MAGNISPVISALRTAHDEVQLGRVLAAVLGSNASAASAFLDLLLSEAEKDPAIGARARNLKVPREVACSSERDLLRHGRGRVRKQAKSLGRVDLYFSTNEFRLACELKLDSRYQQDQIARYLDAKDTWVISIVRRPGGLQGKARETALSSSRWLGEVSWASIQGGLRRIPLSDTTRSHWIALLDVMEGDDEFLPERRRRARDEDVTLVDAVARRSLVSLAETPSVPEPVRNLLRQFSVTSRADIRWAVASIRGPAGDGSRKKVPFFRVLLRDRQTGTPRVVVEWHPPMLWRQRAMRRELERHNFFHQSTRKGAYYVSQDDVRIESGDDEVARVSQWVEGRLQAVAAAGWLDFDAKRLLKQSRK